MKVEVDPEAWAEEFHIENKPSRVRADVKQYFDGLCKDQVQALGLYPLEEA